MGIELGVFVVGFAFFFVFVFFFFGGLLRHFESSVVEDGSCQSPGEGFEGCR